MAKRTGKSKLMRRRIKFLEDAVASLKQERDELRSRCLRHGPSSVNGRNYDGR